MATATAAQTADVDDDAPARGTPGRRVRLRRTVIAAALLAWPLAVVAVLGFSLLRAHHLLSAAQDSARAGDVAAAARQVSAADRWLGRAAGALDSPPADLAAATPVLGPGVRDGRHLVAALRDVTAPAARLLAHADGLDAATLYRGGRVDLAVTGGLLEDVRATRAGLTAAGDDLAAVQGGRPWGRLAALADGASPRLASAGRALDVGAGVLADLPAATGTGGRRSYVVAVMNPAELRPYGGALLSLLRVDVADGHVSVGQRGQTFDLTGGNAPLLWPRLRTDPWSTPAPRALVSSAFSADWPTTGEQFLRAYGRQFGVRPDGVVAVDLGAVAALLDVIGPVEVPEYGRVTADNLADVLLQSGYRRLQDVNQRHDVNDALMDTVLERAVSSDRPGAQAGALLRSAGGRHVVAYFRRPALQAAADLAGLSGRLDLAAGDHVAAFTVNTNASKVDIAQAVGVEHRVVLRPDGSARVTTTLRLRNDLPGPRPADDAGRGYLTTLGRPALGLYLPPGATQVSTDDADTPSRAFAEQGRPVLLWQRSVEPGATVEVSVSYVLPGAVVRVGDRLVYRLTIDPQPTLTRRSARVVVTPGPGWTVPDAAGWRREGGSLARGVDLDARGSVELPLTRAG